jgi:hypothetical protein
VGIRATFNRCTAMQGGRRYSLQSPPPLTHRLNEGGRHSYYIVTTGRARLYKGNLLTMAAQWLERVRRHRWANLHVGQ